MGLGLSMGKLARRFVSASVCLRSSSPAARACADAALRAGREIRELVHAMPPAERGPMLREYVRVATSGRNHLPVAVGAPLSEFEQIADRYPVFRIDPPDR